MLPVNCATVDTCKLMAYTQPLQSGRVSQNDQHCTDNYWQPTSAKAIRTKSLQPIAFLSMQNTARWLRSVLVHKPLNLGQIIIWTPWSNCNWCDGCGWQSYINLRYSSELLNCIWTFLLQRLFLSVLILEQECTWSRSRYISWGQIHFSPEFMTAMISRVKPTGVFCQYLVLLIHLTTRHYSSKNLWKKEIQ